MALLLRVKKQSTHKYSLLLLTFDSLVLFLNSYLFLFGVDSIEAQYKEFKLILELFCIEGCYCAWIIEHS